MKTIYHDFTYFIDKSFDLDSFYGFLNVEVSSGTCDIALLPIKSLTKNAALGIIYLIGTFRGIYFSRLYYYKNSFSLLFK